MLKMIQVCCCYILVFRIFDKECVLSGHTYFLTSDEVKFTQCEGIKATGFEFILDWVFIEQVKTNKISASGPKKNESPK